MYFTEQNTQSFNRYTYANNNPYLYKDPDGKAAETVFDAISLGLSIQQFARNPTWGNFGAMAFDSFAMATPFVPGGMGISRRIASNLPSANIEKGGLNLFKWKDPTSLKATGWKEGDRFFYLPDKGSPKANWKQNEGFLRSEMKKELPIYDSYRHPISGIQKETDGFLNAERRFLESRGWNYNSKKGAYYPNR